MEFGKRQVETGCWKETDNWNSILTREIELQMLVPPSMPQPLPDLGPLTDLLACRTITVLAGAGMSTESGIRDYGGGRPGATVEPW